MRLYSYYRSSAAYRVRIGLNLKQIEHSIVPVNLLTNEHRHPDYIAKQAQGLVPCLEVEPGQYLAQSGAILAYLDGLYPTTKLLPLDPFQAAKIQSFVDIIACDIHPVCNLRVLNYLTGEFNIAGEDRLIWYRHWITLGFEALETMLGDSSYCFGEKVTLADLYLIPQVYNALRFEVVMASFPKIMDVYRNCNQLAAFVDAAPEHQPDAV